VSCLFINTCYFPKCYLKSYYQRQENEKKKLINTLYKQWNTLSYKIIMEDIITTCTGCPYTLCTPLHSITGQCQTSNIYIFMIPHQFQIYIQDFRSPNLIDLLTVPRFMIRWSSTFLCCQWYNKNDYKIANSLHSWLSHFKAYILRHAMKHIAMKI